MKRSSNLLIWLAIAVVVVGIIVIDYLVGPGHRIVSVAEEEMGITPTEAKELVLPVEENELIRKMMALHAKYSGNATLAGGNATVGGKPFALAVATVDGRIFHVGEHNATFALGSAGRAVILASALKQAGPSAVMSRVGMFATGMPAASMLALEARPVKLQNPFTVVGALGGVCLAGGSGAKGKIAAMGEMLGELTGAKSRLTESSDSGPGRYRTLALAYEAADMGLVSCNPDDAVMVHNTVAGARADLADLAVLGATLANLGVNPVTAKRVLSQDQAMFVMAAMSVGGLSDMSGPWTATVGLPALYTESGALMAVVPGRLAVAAYAPQAPACHGSTAAAAVIEFIRGHNLHPYAFATGRGVAEARANATAQAGSGSGE